MFPWFSEIFIRQVPSDKSRVPRRILVDPLAFGNEFIRVMGNIAVSKGYCPESFLKTGRSTIQKLVNAAAGFPESPHTSLFSEMP